jgi:hypothetical protein
MGDEFEVEIIKVKDRAKPEHIRETLFEGLYI